MPAKTEKQRRLFGIALSYKRRKIKLSELKRKYKNWKQIVRIARSMSEKKLEEWASKK